MKFAALALALVFAAAAHAQDVPDCTASQLALSNDVSHDADFKDTSHAGTMLSVKNTGSAACRIAPFLHVTFADDAGKTLDTLGKVPGTRGMHPGPVVQPPVLEPGATATATIRWTNDDVFQNTFCIDPTRLNATVGTVKLTIPWDAHMCGESSQPIVFEITRVTAPSTAK